MAAERRNARVQALTARAAWHLHPARRAGPYGFLTKSQWLSREELEQVQLAALNRLLAAARAIPFYQERLQESGLDQRGLSSLGELAALPPLERRDLQLLGVEGLSRSGRLVLRRSTSGSTGQPVELLWPLEMMRWVDAVERRSREWLGVELGDRTLYVRALSGSGRTTRLRNWVKNSQRLEPGSLDNPSTRSLIIRRLRRESPALVAGNSKGLYVLARGLLESGVNLGARVVVASGSSLREHYREAIESAFGCRAHERYGAIETGLITHPCREAGSQHIPAETLLVEIVGDDGNPAGADETGHVLVTCLRNRTMPLIRYRIGDLASLDTSACSCGRGLPVLRALVGRSNDLLMRTDGRLVPPEVVVRRLMAVAGPSLLEFEIVQRANLHIEARVVQRGELDAESYRARIAGLLDDVVGLRGATAVDRVDDIPAGPDGKMRHIHSFAVRDGTSS